MKINSVTVDESEKNPLYDWHANLFYFDRRKGIILMNNKTRYCITLYGLKAEHFKRLDSIIKESIKETFLAEGFSEDKINTYLKNCGDIKYSKTYDRSILGQINDFQFSISHKIEDYIPNNQVNLVELNRWTGQIVCLSLPEYPIKLLRQEFNKMK